MRKILSLTVLAALLAACGGDARQATAPAPKASPAATAPAGAEAEREPHDEDALAGYSEAVREYYGDDHGHDAADPSADVEAEYHQPPMPAEAEVGGSITLTGTNIGIRQQVTVTKVARTGKYVAVHVRFENTGIAVYEAAIVNAAVTYADGDPVGLAEGAQASCSKGLNRYTVRIEVSQSKSGCLLFPAKGRTLPERFQLGLENVPADAGGIWNLG
jgi:hypothetical protein